MALTFNPFPPRIGLIDGAKLNQLFTGAMSFAGSLTSLAVAGALSFSGAASATVVSVKATGATQGNARAIPATAFFVSVAVTASTEGVKLPAAATGKMVMVAASPTVGAKVYAFVTGQVIGAATTATTAYALVKNTTTLFAAVDKTHWRLFKGS